MNLGYFSQFHFSCFVGFCALPSHQRQGIPPMRVSDERYAKDRRALEVAARLIDFEARTSTIRQLTGLADTRIRSLSKACGVDGRTGSRVRHRGSSPSRIGNLLGKDKTKSEAAALLGLCQLMGVASAIDSVSERNGNRVSRAERL